MDHPYPPPLLRNLITLFAMSGGFVTQLDITIANVALPHMQASTSASREQITWVLTSYIVTSAIFIPLSGWLAGRIGRKRLFLVSMAGFTVASMLCGLAANFGQLVAFRMLQGAFGAALVPMSQAVMVDINPPERHGKAMAIWGIGVIIGPLIGPILGGWLTDNWSWRWVFFINLPFGIIAFLGLAAFLPEWRDEDAPRLDFFGFGTLAVSIGAFQLMLDRGQLKDWFQSTEIWILAAIAATAFYAFIVHSFTAKRPFINPALFKDTNYAVSQIFGFSLGGLMYGVMALQPPMMATLMHYPIMAVGLVMLPRGIGSIAGMPFAGALTGKVDTRLLILFGIAMNAWSTWLMSQVNLQMDFWLVVFAGLIQGFGTAFLFVPVTTAAFATIRPGLRNEAAAMNSLIRSFGSAIWISILQTLTIRNEATVHSRLAEGVRPDNPAVAYGMPDFDFSTVPAIASMHGEVARQALMVAYSDSFWLLFLISLALMPLVFLLRTGRSAA
ncbi:MAG: DHA2 family efflux MFS transporter permease subunit [Novosphingobium sp.]|nr:DHA2 family efflux MFS transporter permease subunit [Novosphingobium sp.]